MPVQIGTSGWQYRDWRGVLYASGVPQRSWLGEYARHFAVVECNNAFYRLPSPEVFAHWKESIPADFTMAMKASRFLTHIKRLREPEEPVERFLRHAEPLGDRLGPVLLQLPPTLQADHTRLDACLACFPREVRVAVEPRHPSWWNDEVRSVMHAHGAAMCWADRESRAVTPLWRTAEWGYVRFHEGAASPWPRYGTKALQTWARRIADTWPDGDVHVYFNNDPHGAAVWDAVAFARAAAAAGLTPTRVPDRVPAV